MPPPKGSGRADGKAGTTKSLLNLEPTKTFADSRAFIVEYYNNTNQSFHKNTIS